MKKISISLFATVLFVLYSCTTMKYHNELSRMHKDYGLDFPVQVGIIMADTIDSSQENIPVYLEVENLTNKIVNICNLSYWHNSLPQLQINDSIIDRSIRVRPGTDKEYLTLNKSEKRVFKFTFSFDQIYNLDRLSPGEYRLFFVVRPLYDYPYIGYVSLSHTFFIR